MRSDLKPPSRRDLRRALVLNAATKPVNVLVPSGVVVAGLLVQTPWLLLVAFVCWLALLVTTFFDEREAWSVGERERAARRGPAPRVRAEPIVAPAIARRWEAALAARASIRHAVEASEAPLEDVTREVDALIAAMRPNAARAQRIHEALAADPPERLRRRVEREPSEALEAKLRALERLQHRLDRLLAEIDHVVTTLQTVHAEILAADGVEQDELAGQVSDLRTRVQLLAADEPAA